MTWWRVVVVSAVVVAGCTSETRGTGGADEPFCDELEMIPMEHPVRHAPVCDDPDAWALCGDAFEWVADESGRGWGIRPTDPVECPPESSTTCAVFPTCVDDGDDRTSDGPPRCLNGHVPRCVHPPEG